MAMPITPLKLPAALEEFVASQVRNGAYRSREAAIVEVAVDCPLAPWRGADAASDRAISRSACRL
jgi:hypothetical protein